MKNTTYSIFRGKKNYSNYCSTNKYIHTPILVAFECFYMRLHDTLCKGHSATKVLHIFIMWYLLQ